MDKLTFQTRPRKQLKRSGFKKPVYGATKPKVRITKPKRELMPNRVKRAKKELVELSHTTKVKFCNLCSKTKEIHLFGKDIRCKSGLSSKCKSCNYVGVKKWRTDNPEKHSIGRKLYKTRHPEKTKEQARKDSQKNYYKLGQKSRIKSRYGLLLEEYNSIKNRQNNLCAICRKKEYEKELSIDHCHKTGKVRGLLCQKCNTAIGLLNDDILLLKKTILYLKNNEN